MQTRHALGDQPLTHPSGQVDPHLAHRLAVLLRPVPRRGAQALGQVVGQRAPRQLDHPLDLTQAGDRHETRDYRLGALLRIGRDGSVPQPEVVLDVPEHLRDGVLGPRAQLADQDLGVVVEVAGPVVPLGEGGHAHVVLTHLVDQPHELLGVVQPLRVGRPLTQRVPGRVAAEREDVGDPRLAVHPDHVGELGHRVPDRREVGDGDEVGLADDALHDPDGPVPRRPARPVGHGDERRTELGEHGGRTPETLLGGLVAGRVELDGERHPRGGGRLDPLHDAGVPATARLVGVG